MTKISLRFWAAIALTAAVPALALAAGPGFPRSEKYFKQLDADANGKLSLAEINARAEKRILRMDRDDDGTVSGAEIEAWLKQGMEKRRDFLLADYDTNRDGVISRDELSAVVSIEFGKADKDADGGVSLDESRSYRYVRAAADQVQPDEEEE